MEFAPPPRQQEIDQEILQLIDMEKMVYSICREDADSFIASSVGNFTEEYEPDPTISTIILLPYLNKAISIVKREFLNKYKTNYTILANNYLKESSSRVNRLIASYVQLARTTSFEKYARSANQETNARDQLEKERLYNESKDIFESSDKIFKRSFRDPYLSIVLKVEALLKEYEELKENCTYRHGFQFTFSQFNRLKGTRNALRKTIDEHLINMLGLTRVEAKLNIDAAA